MKLHYYHNNSGGNWWLTNDDFVNMEKAGWVVDWITYSPAGVFGRQVAGQIIKKEATSAFIETDDVAKTIREWELITGQNAASIGCTCCGPPHHFFWEFDNEDDGDYHYLKIETSSSWSV